LAVISSIAGFRGIGGSSSYSASKAYQRIYFEAISQGAKSKNKNITFSTIIPGFVDTEIIAGRNYPLTLSCEKASRIIYNGLVYKKRHIYVDGKWRFIAFLMRIIPNWIWERMKKE
jgi:short-subunit dehydrogenase